MNIEVYVHIAHINDLISGKAVNCKVNYASQYDIKITLDASKYVITVGTYSQNTITVRRKTLKDRLKLTKKVH